MRKFGRVFLTGILAATLGAGFVLGQSSGSFNYADTATKCVMDASAGTLSGGAGITALKTTMKTSSGQGNVFLLSTSAVIGLLTDVTVSSKQSGTTVSSSAQAGVDFLVTATALQGQVAPVVTPSTPVTFDSRFIQISTNLFNAIAAQCLANPDGSGGCFLTFNESTLSAHSFQWVVTGLSSGDYGLKVAWSPSTNVVGIGNAETCVGPVVFTAVQNKIFTPSTGISF